MTDDSTPATKADVQQITQRVDSIDEKLDKLMNSMTQLFEHVSSEAEETRRHFDVIAEQNREELLAANRDEIESLKDARGDHEQRLQGLEKAVGLSF